MIETERETWRRRREKERRRDGGRAKNSERLRKNTENYNKMRERTLKRSREKVI